MASNTMLLNVSNSNHSEKRILSVFISCSLNDRFTANHRAIFMFRKKHGSFSKVKSKRAKVEKGYGFKIRPATYPIGTNARAHVLIETTLADTHIRYTQKAH